MVVGQLAHVYCVASNESVSWEIGRKTEAPLTECWVLVRNSVDCDCRQT
jgi:hypothetical protein